MLSSIVVPAVILAIIGGINFNFGNLKVGSYLPFWILRTVIVFFVSLFIIYFFMPAFCGPLYSFYGFLLLAFWAAGSIGLRKDRFNKTNPIITNGIFFSGGVLIVLLYFTVMT